MSLSPQQREFKLQLAVIAHLESAFKYSGLHYFHVPNRGGDATDGYFKKLMGAKAGTPDLVFGWRDGNCGFIELKVLDGKVSSPQNKFLSAWAAIGWKTAVCRSVRGVHHTLTLWGLKPSHTEILEPDYSSKEEKFERGYDWMKP
jgi:hypothetical protein